MEENGGGDGLALDGGGHKGSPALAVGVGGAAGAAARNFYLSRAIFLRPIAATLAPVHLPPPAGEGARQLVS